MPRETGLPDPGPSGARPPGRRRRWPWVAGGLLALPVAGIGLGLALFDPNGLKPRIEAAVQQATGRQLTLAGPIGLKLALVPTLTVEGASLANMPTGSRPAMASIRRVELELALLPLLRQRVEVRRLRLVAPDILLETDAAGRANWIFAGSPPGPAASADPPAGPAPEPEPGPAGGRRLAIAVDAVSIEQGRLAWRDGATGASRVLGIPALSVAARGAGGTGPLRGQGQVVLDDIPVAVEAETGPLAGLVAPAAGGPAWPLRARLAAAGATAVLEGGIADPAARRGWHLGLEATVPDARSLAPLLPGLALPPLQGVTASLALADSGAGGPALTRLDLGIGASPLDALLPGLALTNLTARQAGPGAPLTLVGGAVLRGLPLALGGSIGSPMLLQASPPRPLPIDLTATAAGATATVKGEIADPRRLEGVALLVALGVPDLAALAPLAGRPLPAVTNLTLGASLSERGAGFAEGAMLHGLRIASSAGDAGGDLALLRGPRPGVQGSLVSQRLDLDALRPPPAPAAPGSAAGDAAGGSPGAAAAPRDGRLIPPLPLPVAALRHTDSTLDWTIGTLRSGGVTLRDTRLQAVVQDGQGRLDPLTTTLPGGQLTLRAAADARATPPVLQLAARSDGIELAPLLAALHAPGGTSGRFELDMDLRGQGADLRAVAATAAGHLSLAVTNGQIESGSGSLLGQAVGELRQALPQLGGLAQGRIALACAATRWRVEGGVARAEALLLDSSLGKVGGGGTADLRDESLALRLQLDLRLPIPGMSQLRIRAPLPVTGSFARPRPDFGPATARGAVGALAEGVAREKGGDIAGEILGALGGALGGAPAGGGAALPACGPALAAARGGRSGPVPASAAEAPAPGAPAEGAPAEGGAAATAPGLRELPKALQAPAQDLLRGLLRGR
ncbi:AsmA family protein [Roseicella frigidaeris]|uniref:AsmA domain-containing protein n=1 Tax=Roseicella frigidaeris TaxID=2230885 RepID=A0A327LZ21_9PROT|nr:AsmA family protein [Roseicella frigidaeris]RAI55397.1 hypothetical protein DOO78_23840 [Roseicella frigidaeris]